MTGISLTSSYLVSLITFNLRVRGKNTKYVYVYLNNCSLEEALFAVISLKLFMSSNVSINVKEY